MNYLNRAALLTPYYALCMGEAEFERECRKLLPKNVDSPPFISDGAHATTHTLSDTKFTDTPVCIVCIKHDKKATAAEICGVLAHEATHVVQALREWIGERDLGDEIEASAIQVVTQSLIETYRPRIVFRQPKKRTKTKETGKA